MQYKVEFTKKAFGDLESIKKYIYNDNMDAARKVVAYIFERIETLLLSNPSVGRAGRVFGTRELVLTKYPYIIPYMVKGDVIYILRVMHTSRNWDIH